VFIDYRDFTGDGPNAPTGGEEAFGDATDIAAQGRQVYDLANFVNPAHPLPPGCNITVRGVAPGASLIGMKVFGAGGAFASVIVQGIDWAVTQDHADILSESFGDFTMPDTARDIIKQFNDAAVRSGIVVSQGSSDSGATAGPSEPATDPLVMDSGGSTNFRHYAQTTSYGFQFSNGTWLNDNISSIAGGGFSQNASTPDFVSPAEADWALCTPNKTLYAECADFKADPFNGAPSPIEAFGGTSQSTPLDAGVAALVIEAYRNSHGGSTPSPLLVKRIMQSTANDLGFPNEEQGAGEVDGLKAVQEAMSVNGGTPTGHGLLFNPAKLTITAPAGSSDSESVAVTNTGSATQTVSAHARALTQVVSDDKQDVTLGSTPTFVDQFGHPRPYAVAHFNVPAGVDRLVVYDAWPGPNARVGVTLIDHSGAFAAFTRPQGDGDHGQVDVRKPVQGQWTAYVFVRDGTYSGPVHLEFVTQRFGAVDSVTPSSLTLGPGQTGHFQYRTRLPSSPGDSGHDLVISDSSGDQTVVPVVLRSLIPVDRHGGTFSGTLFGGNGREFVAQENTFAFDVPPGRKALSVSLAFPDDPNTEVIGTLNDPDGNELGSQSTLHVNGDGSGAYTHGLRATTLSPKPGRWTFVVTVSSPVGGQTLSAPYEGVVSFDPPDISASGLPDHSKVRSGTPITATIRVHNDGPGTEDVFADPRLSNQSETDSVLPVFGPATGLTMPGALSEFVVPTQTNALLGVAQANRPIVLEMGYFEIGEGDPDLIGQSDPNNPDNATAFYAAREVANGPWGLAPSMVGPFDSAQTGTVNTGMLAHTEAFDRNTESSTGDIWLDTVDPSQPAYTPLTLGPGQSGTITVTFTPQGSRGSRVHGTLYVDDFGFRLDTGNEQMAFPYSYRIK
jgi:hypothetical protein